MGCASSKQAETSVSPPVEVKVLQGSPLVSRPAQEGGTDSDGTDRLAEQHPNNNAAPVEREYQAENNSNNDGRPPNCRRSAATATTCAFCCEVFDEERQSAKSRPCKGCQAPLCDACLRKMFLDASRNEADMPPRCCVSIPLSSVRAVLSTEELSRFRDKYEEWGTPNRVYCPIPTCSAFIPPRLLPAAVVSQGHHGRLSDKIIVAADVQPPPPTPPSRPSTFPCHRCAVEICGSCKQLAHPDRECATDSDIDPQLADLLRRLGIKRCPKCRAAVRRMYGCSHMQCRCGAQWCWWCTGPYRMCQARRCPAVAEEEAFEHELNEDADTYRQQLGIDDDDNDNNAAEAQTDHPQPADRPAQEERLISLDAGYDWEVATENFGSEPNVDRVDPFNCTHVWTMPEEQQDLEDSNTREEDWNEYECGRCWQPVVPRPPGYIYLGMKEMFETGSIRLTNADPFLSSSEGRTQHSHQKGFVNVCRRCHLTLCDHCRAVERHQRSQ